MFSGYVDVALVGEGGLGRIFRATRQSTGGVVAIKELRDVAEGSLAWHRARRELDALLRLKGHPYVVSVGRAGSLDGPVAAEATGGSQGFAQLVCLLGDFTKVMPTDLAIESLTRTLAWLADQYDVAAGADSTVKFVSRGSNRWPAGTAVTAKTV